MTKAEKRNWVYRSYKKASCMLVTQFYKRPSSNKLAVDNRIRHEMVEMNGTRYRITGGNCYFFNCAYCFKKDDKWYLRYITRCSTTDYELSQSEVYDLCLEV